MNSNDFDLNLLRVFEAVYAERQLTRAGDRLGITQPTVSNALARLRKSLNDPLFIRTAEGMQPTPLAETFAEYVIDALGRLREGLAQSAHFEPSTHNRPFLVAMSDYASNVLLPDLVDGLRERAPDNRMAVLPLRRDEAQDALKSGRLDLALTDELKGPGLYQRALYRERFVSLVAENHPDIGAEPTLEQFLAHGHLLYSLDGRGSGIVDRLLGERGLKRKIAVRTPYVSVIPQIVARTDLIVTLPARVANMFRRQWPVKLVKTPLDIPRYALHLYWHEKFHRDPVNQWLREQINHCAKAMSNDSDHSLPE